MNLLKKLYNYLFVKKEAVRIVVMPKEEFMFELPKVAKHSLNYVDVIVYSYYLKSLGLEQKLQYGDWYATGNLDEKGNHTGKTLIHLYTKLPNEDKDENFDDFEFEINGQYVRIVPQDEALNLIKALGFNYAYSHTPIDIQEDNKTCVAFENPTSEVVISASATNPHAAHLKAACLIVSQYKAVVEANNNMGKLNMFKFRDEENNEN